MPTYTFRCCEEFDRRVGYGEVALCPTCGRSAQRAEVYRIGFGGFARTPGSERDYSRDFKAFSEAGQELDHHAQQRGENPPPLYQLAKARVRDLARKGAKDANDLS